MSMFDFEYRTAESPLIETVWRSVTYGEFPESFTSEAASNWEIVFTKEEAKTTISLRGPETQASPAPIPQNAEFIGIVFKLGTFMPHLPVKELVNAEQHQEIGASNRFHLYGSSWEVPNYENVDTFINRLLSQEILVQDSLVSDILMGRNQPKVTPRTIQRRFLQATGLSHGTILQIERANEASKLLKKGYSILDVVYGAGYSDQPHLTRSLKHYLGRTPAEIVRSATSDESE